MFGAVRRDEGFPRQYVRSSEQQIRVYFNINFMTAPPLKLQSILEQPPEDLSDLSIELSFILEDILNEKVLTKEVLPLVSNTDDLFLEEDFDDQASSINKPAKSFKNTITDSGGKGKSVQQIATSHTSSEPSRIRKIKKPQDQTVSSILHNKLANINLICSESKVGFPSAITTIGNGCLIIGTTLANIVIFDIGQDGPTIIKSQRADYGAILTITVSKDQVYIACGCESGFLFLIDKQSATISKIIPPEILNVSISKLIFVGDNYSNLIKNDNQGNIFVYSVQKFMWQTGVLSRRLLPHISNVVYCDIKSIIINRKKIVCLSSYDYVLCLMFFDSSEPEVIGKINRPQSSKEKIPNIELGSFDVGGEIKEGLFVSWGNTIQLYYYNPLERSSQFSFYKSFVLDALMDFEIYSIHQLTLELILLIDNRNSFKLVNFMQNPSKIYEDFQISKGIVSHKLPNRNGKSIRSFSNTVCKATATHKDIYYISGTEIVRGRLLAWAEYIRYLMQEAQWDKLFAQSLQMHSKRIDAFSDKVDPSKKEIFENIINKYVENRIPTLPSNKSLISESIQYCLLTGLYNVLFNKLFSIFEKEGFTEVFIESLEPFILQNLILQLPNNDLLEELMIAWSDTKPQLLEQLLVQLNKSSMDYLLTVELCRKYNLFIGLLYVSEINGDFITPLNRLIETSQKSSIEENKEGIIMLVYQFIRKTSNCMTISGDKTLKQELVRNGLPRLLLWLLIEENMEWLIDFNSQMYFQELERLLEMPIVKYYIDSEFETEDIIGQLFSNCRILQERIRSSQVERNLAHCLLRASRLWELNEEQAFYMIQHYDSPSELDDMTEYIDRHYERLKQHPVEWNRIIQKMCDQIKAVVYLKEGQEEKGLDLYEKNKNSFNTSVLFEHLSKHSLVLHLEQLLRINYKLCAKYLFEIDSQQIPKHVRKVKAPLYKYLLMRYLFKFDTEGLISWGMDDLILYIISLAKYREEQRVLYELKKAKDNYQFFEVYRQSALLVMKEHHLLLCEAFLSEPKQSFEIYKQLYKQVFETNFEQLLKFEQNTGQDLNNIFNNLTRTLQQLPSQNISHPLWFQLLQTILFPFKKPYKRITVGQEIQKIYKMKGSEKNAFLITLMHIIEQALLVVSSFTTIEEMTHWMEKNLKILELKFIINCFCSTLRIYNQHTQTIQLSNEVISSDIIETFRNAMEIKTKGVSVEVGCEVCGNPLFEEASVAFPCGHGYHKECCSQVYKEKCKVCIEEQLTSKTESKTKALQAASEFRERQSSIRHKASEEIFPTDNQPTKMMYSLMAFDDIVKEQQQDLEKFKSIYEAYMILQ